MSEIKLTRRSPEQIEAKLIEWITRATLAEDRILELERGVRNLLTAETMGCSYACPYCTGIYRQGSFTVKAEVDHDQSCPIYVLQALVAPPEPSASVADDYKG